MNESSSGPKAKSTCKFKELAYFPGLLETITDGQILELLYIDVKKAMDRIASDDKWYTDKSTQLDKWKSSIAE